MTTTIHLCKYKNMLGKPNQGIHAFRIFNVPVADVLFTILGAWIIARYFVWSFWPTLVSLFLLGTLLHLLFCVKTPMTKLLFGER